MKTWLKLVLVLVVVVFFFSCGTKKRSTQKSSSEIEPDKWSYQRDAIRLVLNADPQLNEHDGFTRCIFAYISSETPMLSISSLAMKMDFIYCWTAVFSTQL